MESNPAPTGVSLPPSQEAVVILSTRLSRKLVVLSRDQAIALRLPTLLLSELTLWNGRQSWTVIYHGGERALFGGWQNLVRYLDSPITPICGRFISPY